MRVSTAAETVLVAMFGATLLLRAEGAAAPRAEAPAPAPTAVEIEAAVAFAEAEAERVNGRR